MNFLPLLQSSKLILVGSESKVFSDVFFPGNVASSFPPVNHFIAVKPIFPLALHSRMPALLISISSVEGGIIIGLGDCVSLDAVRNVGKS